MRHPAAAALPCPRGVLRAAALLASLLWPALAHAAAPPAPPPPPLQFSKPQTWVLKPADAPNRQPARGRFIPTRVVVPAAGDDLSQLIPSSPPSANGSVTATETGVEFAGFLRNGREHRFVLTAPSRGSSEWLALGQSYAGLTLVEFDPALEVLAVRTDGRTLRLALKDGRPRAAPQGRETEIVVDAQGQLYVGGEKTPSPDLRWRLENLAQNIPNIFFHLVVIWPRHADGGLVERLGNHIAETVRTLPPELRKRYLSLAWKTAER